MITHTILQDINDSRNLKHKITFDSPCQNYIASFDSSISTIIEIYISYKLKSENKIKDLNFKISYRETLSNLKHVIPYPRYKIIRTKFSQIKIISNFIYPNNYLEWRGRNNGI